MIPVYKLGNNPNEGIRVVKLTCSTEYDFGEPHRHEYFELFVFVDGGGSHMIDFQEFPIYSGSIHIVAPGQIHQVKRELNSSGFVLLFSTDIFPSNSTIVNFLYDHICLSVQEQSPSYKFDSNTKSIVLKTCENAWKDFESNEDWKFDFLQSHLTQLCIHCMRTQNTNNALSEHNNEHYIQFRRLLRSNLQKMKKVKDYAEILNISEKQLSKITTKRTGLSASMLIYKQIVLEAKRLLNSGISIKEVAYELNFDDPAHFSKFFKTQTGITPSQFKG